MHETPLSKTEFHHSFLEHGADSRSVILAIRTPEDAAAFIERIRSIDSITEKESEVIRWIAVVGSELAENPQRQGVLNTVFEDLRALEAELEVDEK